MANTMLYNDFNPFMLRHTHAALNAFSQYLTCPYRKIDPTAQTYSNI